MEGSIVYCPNCGGESDEGARFCKACGKAMSGAGKFEPETVVGPGHAAQHSRPTKSKVAAGVLAIVLGGLGIHKFYLGYVLPGILLIIISLVTCGIVGPIIALIEGILYLTMTDEAFHETYVEDRKDWF